MDSTDLSEELRCFGKAAAKTVTADPKSFAVTAEWLRTLPMCHEIIERQIGTNPQQRKAEPILTVDESGTPVSINCTKTPLFHVYDNEYEVAEREGPICRRLRTAWDAAIYRFSRFINPPQGDDYFALTEKEARQFDEDRVKLAEKAARQLILLTALTFYQSFDSSLVGLNYPWAAPDDSKVNWEGRGAAWAIITSGHFSETILERHAKNALECLNPSERPASNESERCDVNVNLAVNVIAATTSVEFTPAEHQPPKGAKPVRRPNRTGQEVAEDEGKILGFLSATPDAKRDEVAAKTGIAPAHVSESLAWKGHTKQRKNRRAGNRARGVGRDGPNIEDLAG